MGIGIPNGKVLSLLEKINPWGFAAGVIATLEIIRILVPQQSVQIETDQVVEVLEKINATQEVIATEQIDILRDSRRILTESQVLLEAAHERGIKIVPTIDRIDRNLDDHRRISESKRSGSEGH